MKFLRSMLIPIVCFVSAWAITFFSTGSRRASPGGEPPVSRHQSGHRMKRGYNESLKMSVLELAEEFQTSPTGDWSGLWDGFATTAGGKDLESIAPRRLNKDAWERVRRDGRNIIYLLATEELALRADRSVALEPGAYATLAEVDPEAVWKKLERNNFKDLSIGVMRTLARRDPAGTFARLRTMSAPQQQGQGSDEDSMKSGSPLGAILSAWARKDPPAAAAAVMTLTPSERSAVAGEVAETWAYQDAPAALRFAMGFLEPGAENFYDMRLESILRTGLARQPEATAELIALNEVLREKMTHSDFKKVVRLWQDADPEAVLGWVNEEEKEQESGEPRDETTRWNSRGQALFNVIKQDPVAMVRFIRNLAATDSDSAAACLQSWSGLEPERSGELAAELGIELPEAIGRKTDSLYYDPAGACDLWLDELRQQQDPQLALDALGWHKNVALGLAERIARFFPQKAGELSRVLPASWLGPVQPHQLRFGERMVKNLRRSWPDLEVSSESPPPPVSENPASKISQKEFELDPAAAAERMLSEPFPASDVTRAVEWWGPYDPAACGAWLAGLPEGDVRKAGEVKLRNLQTGYQPPGIMEQLSGTVEKEEKLRELLRAVGK